MFLEQNSTRKIFFFYELMAEQQFNLEDLFSGVISANIYSKEIPQFKINEISEKTNVGIKLTNRLRNDEQNPTSQCRLKFRHNS